MINAQAVIHLSIVRADKMIRIVAPPATDFRYPWNELTKAVAGLGLKQMGSPPLCVIFEFDPRDALDCYEKYVMLCYVL